MTKIYINLDLVGSKNPVIPLSLLIEMLIGWTI